MPSSEVSVVDSTWYETERNSERLVKAVTAVRPIRRLSGEDIWWLLQLTWITVSRGHVTKDHWRRLKVPALAHLLKVSVSVSSNLNTSLDNMHLPQPITQTPTKTTGFANAYPAYRNSLRTWCSANEKELRSILIAANLLKSNDQGRFDLASNLERLPPVWTPLGKRKMSASNLITPLVACLDPKRRFPIINGEKGVHHRLTKLGLVNHSLEDQVKGFIGLIGQFGLADAFAVDTMSEGQMDNIIKRAQMAPKTGSAIGGRTTLPFLDEAERKALQESRTITYRRRHNKMTTRFKNLLPGMELTQGTSLDCRYDVLVTDYDGKDRDLLIEVKPDPDKGSIRIAIGQLLDYRRFLPKQAATDLAILTILRPSSTYTELMQELQITPLWFTEESCQTLAGEGKSWKSLKAQMTSGGS